MANRTCSVPGCEGSHYGRGWCSMHWQRWRTKGDLFRVAFIRGDDDARFESKVERTEDCWYWTGTRNWSGYGVFQITENGHRRGMHAHRYAYQRHIGPIPDGLELDHLCRRRACVNHDHLEAVTRLEHRHRRLYQTHCRRGHELIGDNVKWDDRGNRSCLRCANDRRRERRAAGKAG